MVEAHDDFVDGYAVIMKNGGLEVPKWILTTHNVWKKETGGFLYEGSHWRMDIYVWMVTAALVMKLYWAKGGLLGQPTTMVA